MDQIILWFSVEYLFAVLIHNPNPQPHFQKSKYIFKVKDNMFSFWNILETLKKKGKYWACYCTKEMCKKKERKTLFIQVKWLEIKVKIQVKLHLGH